MEIHQKVKTQSTSTLKYISNQLSQPFRIYFNQPFTKPIFSQLRTGWTNLENAKYTAYILHNKNNLDKRSQNQLWGLYKEMSNFIETRNFRQCKNYHIKLLFNLRSVDNIAQFLYTNIQDFAKLLFIQLQNLKIFNSKRTYEKTLDNKINLQEEKSKPIISKINFKQTAAEYIIPSWNSKQPQMLKNPQIQKSGMRNSNQEQWIQCHRLFLEWTARLKQLQQMNQTL